MPRPEAPGLAGLQARLLADLTGRRSRRPQERAAVFAAPARGTIEERWHVYTSGYLARLQEALENDYPAVRRILGEGAFRSLTARYLKRCPPRAFDIGRAGDRLARFLGSDALSRDLPFLPDLARLEWCLAEAFVAADVEPLRWGDLAARGPRSVAETRFVLRPGVAVVRSAWPLLDLLGCRDLADEEISIPLEGRPCNVLVYRQGLEVRRRVLEDADAAFLEHAQGGLRLDALAGRSGIGHAALVGRFRYWVAEGLLRKPEEPPLAAPRF